MPALFTVDAYPGENFKGTVRQIRNAPQTVQNVVTYDAVIDVENPDLRLKPGMTANVTFVYAEKDDVLRVPNAALRFRPPAEMMPKREGGSAAGGGGRGGNGGGHGGGNRGDQAADHRTVWVLKPGAGNAPPTLAPVQVQTGVSDGTYTEVVAGDVKEGDTLVTEIASMGDAKPEPGGRGMPRRMF
jgi:HlyD family secretion protein